MSEVLPDQMLVVSADHPCPVTSISSMYSIWPGERARSRACWKARKMGVCWQVRSEVLLKRARSLIGCVLPWREWIESRLDWVVSLLLVGVLFEVLSALACCSILLLYCRRVFSFRFFFWMLGGVDYEEDLNLAVILILILSFKAIILTIILIIILTTNRLNIACRAFIIRGAKFVLENII